MSEITKPFFLGFECTPAYIEDIHPEMFKFVLRNLLVGAMVLNGPLMLLVYCLVPSDEISGNNNMLSLLAQSAGGPWLRLLIVIDAVLVLTGGIFMGLFTVCGLIDRLAKSVHPDGLERENTHSSRLSRNLGTESCRIYFYDFSPLPTAHTHQ